ncbi:MAG TPA: site-specific integrase [Puia sp.]|nr:site-specific integrase [Puia sp.]
MFSEPTIHTTPELAGRTYVEFYFDGERHRLYNGKLIGISCNPNRAKSLAERNKALDFLLFHLRKQLEKGWTPAAEIPLVKPILIIPAIKAFTDLKTSIEAESLSDLYERDLLGLNDHFLAYLQREKLSNLPVTNIGSDHIEQFLQQFKSSPTNYMNRRRTLSALFLRLKTTQKVLKDNPTQQTGKLKEIPHLNLPYKKDQLRKVLEIVRGRHKDVYLCCLLMYGCLLRPHQEIRLLKRGYFDEEFTKISLGGHQNKSRKIRSVLVPEYVRTELMRLGISLLDDGMNIFSHTTSAFNPFYFSTAWARIKENLLEDGLIEQDHTLYSFRHTAAVYMYLKTKDPYKIQQAFGHGSLRVTLIYLRSLGMVIDASLDDLPELPV